MQKDRSKENDNRVKRAAIEQGLQVYTELPIGIAAFDVDGDTIITLFRNRWYYTFLGYDNLLEAEIKDHFFDWYTEADRPKIRRLIKDAYGGQAGMDWVCICLKDKTVGALIKAFPFTVSGHTTAMTILTTVDNEQSVLTADTQVGRHYQTIAKNANHLSFDYNVVRDEMFYVYHHENLLPVERLYDHYLNQQTKIDFVHPSSERSLRWALSGRSGASEMELLIKNPQDGLFYWNRAFYRNMDVGGETHVVGHVELRDARVTNEYRIDKVSGVMERSTFERGMTMLMADGESDPDNMALVLFKINGLNAVDDVYGMEKSNAVIRVIGKTISSQIRGSDLLGRYAGSAFILMLRDIQSQGDADKVAGRMKTHIDADVQRMELTVPVAVMTEAFPIKDGEDWFDDIAEAYVRLDDET